MHAATLRLLVLALALSLTACATDRVYLGHDHRDRGYDPCYKCGETLFDQVKVRQ